MRLHDLALKAGSDGLSMSLWRNKVELAQRRNWDDPVLYLETTYVKSWEVCGAGQCAVQCEVPCVEQSRAHKEEELQPVEDGVDAQNRLPVLPQDVETDIAVQIDVRVIHL